MKLPYNQCETSDKDEYKNNAHTTSVNIEVRPLQENQSKELYISSDENLSTKNYTPNTRPFTSRCYTLPEPSISKSKKESNKSSRGWTCCKFVIVSIGAMILPMGMALYMSLRTRNYQHSNEHIEKNNATGISQRITTTSSFKPSLSVYKSYDRLVKIENGNSVNLRSMIEMVISQQLGRIVKLDYGSGFVKMTTQCGHDVSCVRDVPITEIRHTSIGRDMFGTCYLRNEGNDTWMIGRNCLYVEIRLEKGVAMIENVGMVNVGVGYGATLQNWFRLPLNRDSLELARDKFHRNRLQT